jgi:hypothetical protein
MAEPRELPLTGGCLCGAVRFEVFEPALDAIYCHCTRCQRRTGSAFSANARIAPGSLRITKGEAKIRSWKPADGWAKAFCVECGSHLYSASPDAPPVIGVRMGAFDDDPGVRPSAHQFVSYAAAWEPLPDDGLPRFPEGRPPDSRARS